SAGVPKGVVVTHRDVAGLVADRCWGEPGGWRMLFHAPHGFDASVLEVWVPLLSGGTVVVAAGRGPGLGGGRGLGAARGGWRGGAGAGGLWGGLWAAGLFRVGGGEGRGCRGGVGEVLTGGDVVPAAAVARVLAACPRLVVRHLYGPTEVTVCATQFAVGPG